MEETRICGFCTKELNQPKNLPECLHSFWQECLKEMKTMKNQIKCITCGKESAVPPGGVSDFQDDTNKTQVLKEYATTKSKGNNKLEENAGRCSEHGKENIKFCSECGQLQRAKCEPDFDHSELSMIPIEQAQEYLSDLTQICENELKINVRAIQAILLCSKKKWNSTRMKVKNI